MKRLPYLDRHGVSYLAFVLGWAMFWVGLAIGFIAGVSM